jgi:UDP-N-acetylmuramoylalanine--D-glutamate ligase
MFKLSKDKKINRQQIKGKKIAVLGAARSGIAVANLLASSGASVLLSDKINQSLLQIPFENTHKQSIEVETGQHSEKILNAELICVSPGIPLTIPILKKAVDKGIPMVGEIEVASWFCESKMSAITGSNGKTTTTTLAGNILKQLYENVTVAGNIGQPFAQSVTTTAPDGIVVLEISSFQLETIFSFHPDIIVMMNLSANHLDRYPDFETYAAAKLNILKNRKTHDIFIYNSDDDFLSKNLSGIKSGKFMFSLKPHKKSGAFWQGDSVMLQFNGKNEQIKLHNYKLRGPHNQYNIMAAVLIGQLMGVSAAGIREAIEDFSGIEHRLEEVRNLNGILFINDSKATTIESLAFALQSFDEKIVLIAGGKDKGGDFKKVLGLLQKKVKTAILIGEASERIRQSWMGVIPITMVENLEQAIGTAREKASQGDVVLLSPACSSFDMFLDYEDRGNQFKNIVKDLV